MTEQAMVPYGGEMTLQETMALGKTLAASGYFDDAKEAAQAVVKILAGRELGLGPIAAMTGIHIIQKKVTLGANLMAATIKRDPRYDYQVIEMTAKRCEIVFYEKGRDIGCSVFSLEDAKNAGLSGANWTKYPRNMLFARAMSNGSRWYCPDAFGGAPVYTPEELGAQVDGAGDLIEMPAQPTQRRSAPTTAPQAIDELFGDYDPDLEEAKREVDDLELPPHWITDDTVRTRFWAWTGGTLGLDSGEVHAALGVEHVNEFPGTMAEAKSTILNWVSARKEAERENA